MAASAGHSVTAVVVRYNARAGESVPVEIDGSERGRIAMADLTPRPA
jgi:hypothetical protein